MSYGRSRYFTIQFFMLKISRIRPCENNRSYGISLPESNKMGLYFSEFSTIFYAIYKNQQTCKYY
jgi:hypothetical protein